MEIEVGLLYAAGGLVCKTGALIGYRGQVYDVAGEVGNLVRLLWIWYRCRFFFFSSRRRHTRLQGDWSSDVCSSDLRASRFARSSGRPSQEPTPSVSLIAGRVKYRFGPSSTRSSRRVMPSASPIGGQRSEERRVGKGVDLGGRRIIKKKKTNI